jgi:ADP-L-glycero-D-manno-heptose 6-epimerase
MNKPQLIVTGAIGFIGMNVVLRLNELGYTDLILVDHKTGLKSTRVKQLKYTKYFEKNVFLEKIKSDPKQFENVSVVIHLGACSDTTESDKKYLLDNNTNYSKVLYKFCLKYNVRLIYASSAATYGDGSAGYSDTTRNLKPLNYYGLSKYLFDEWVLENAKKPPQWVGLKFFNVYGPYEDHKGKMASVVFHGYHQVKKDGSLKLFKSYKKRFKDGEQNRDFIYVADVVKVILFFLENKNKSGIFNVGTGSAETFLELGKALFKSLKLKSNIQFIEMPETLKNKYQYFTEADIKSLRKVGYSKNFSSVQKGVSDYVKNYLEK